MFRRAGRASHRPALSEASGSPAPGRPLALQRLAIRKAWLSAAGASPFVRSLQTADSKLTSRDFLRPAHRASCRPREASVPCRIGLFLISRMVNLPRAPTIIAAAPVPSETGVRPGHAYHHAHGSYDPKLEAGGGQARREAAGPLQGRETAEGLDWWFGLKPLRKNHLHVSVRLSAHQCPNLMFTTS
jgi:hypothetical protein